MPASEKPRAEQGPLAEAKTMQARTLIIADGEPEPIIFLVSSHSTDSRGKPRLRAHPKMCQGLDCRLPLTSPQTLRGLPCSPDMICRNAVTVFESGCELAVG